ncbi:M55 family metallopeptidase [Actinomycetes bacterium KLBMP 9797]
MAELRVLISADLEGISGIVHSSETNPERYDYERGRRLMTAEVNAAIAGVLAAAPDARVRVTDAHGPFRNLLPEDLDRRASLIRGRPRALGMLAGLDGGADAVLFVGYHARAGSGPGVLAHTMSDAILDVRIDGASVGEIGLNALLAGAHGAPVVLLTGDDAACAEFAELVPRAETVAVKRALGQTSAEVLHPAEARERVRAAAETAIRQRDTVSPLRKTGPVEVAVDVHYPSTVDLAMLVPGARRAAGGRTVAYTASDFPAAYRVIQLLVHLGTPP